MLRFDVSIIDIAYQSVRFFLVPFDVPTSRSSAWISAHVLGKEDPRMESFGCRGPADSHLPQRQIRARRTRSKRVRRLSLGYWGRARPSLGTRKTNFWKNKIHELRWLQTKIQHSQLRGHEPTRIEMNTCGSALGPSTLLWQ